MVSAGVLRVPPIAAPVELREVVLGGLRQRPKRLPSSYFYDDEGSRLFRRIMELPGYYLSRAEHEILTAAAPRLAGAFAGRSLVVADLGAGDGSKTRVLLQALAGVCPDLCYAPIDISMGALDELGVEFDASKLTMTAEFTERKQPIRIFRRPDGSLTNW